MLRVCYSVASERPSILGRGHRGAVARSESLWNKGDIRNNRVTRLTLGRRLPAAAARRVLHRVPRRVPAEPGPTVAVHLADVAVVRRVVRARRRGPLPVVPPLRRRDAGRAPPRRRDVPPPAPARRARRRGADVHGGRRVLRRLRMARPALPLPLALRQRQRAAHHVIGRRLAPRHAAARAAAQRAEAVALLAVQDDLRLRARPRAGAPAPAPQHRPRRAAGRLRAAAAVAVGQLDVRRRPDDAAHGRVGLRARAAADGRGRHAAAQGEREQRESARLARRRAARRARQPAYPRRAPGSRPHGRRAPRAPGLAAEEDDHVETLSESMSRFERRENVYMYNPPMSYIYPFLRLKDSWRRLTPSRRACITLR